MKKVVKFGGSSLADSGQFRKVGAIIRADESRVYVVPSAPGKRFSGDIKVTDMLIEAYRIATEGGDLNAQMEEIKARYDEIISGLGLDFSLDDEFKTIIKTLEDEPTLDYAASRGEYLNGLVMANYLGYEFIDPYDVIFFNEEGNLNSYKTAKVLSARLEKTPKAVIPGLREAALMSRDRSWLPRRESTSMRTGPMSPASFWRTRALSGIRFRSIRLPTESSAS